MGAARRRIATREECACWAADPTRPRGTLRADARRRTLGISYRDADVRHGLFLRGGGFLDWNDSVFGQEAGMGRAGFEPAMFAGKGAAFTARVLRPLAYRPADLCLDARARRRRGFGQPIRLTRVSRPAANTIVWQALPKTTCEASPRARVGYRSLSMRRR